MMAGTEHLQGMGVEVWRQRPDEPEAVQEQLPAEVSKESAPSAGLTGADGPSYSGLNLEELSAVASECQKCGLSRSRTTVVFGAGSPQARVMFIGEAPGADEDLQGKPFVGKSGKLLSSIMQALGLKREDVYIANVLKCRPPMNRDPRPDEARVCSPYLQRQIQIVGPSVIVALGRISAQLLLDTERSLAELRRERHEYLDTGIEVVVTYHPSYMLRRPTEKAKTWEDLLRVRTLLSN